MSFTVNTRGCSCMVVVYVVTVNTELTLTFPLLANCMYGNGVTTAPKHIKYTKHIAS